MLAYNLLQFYFLRHDKKALNKKPLPHIRQQLLPSDNHVIVYWQNYYALFKPYELVGFVVQLSEDARKKIAEKCRRRRLHYCLNHNVFFKSGLTFICNNLN